MSSHDSYQQGELEPRPCRSSHTARMPWPRETTLPPMDANQGSILHRGWRGTLATTTPGPRSRRSPRLALPSSNNGCALSRIPNKSHVSR